MASDGWLLLSQANLALCRAVPLLCPAIKKWYRFAVMPDMASSLTFHKLAMVAGVPIALKPREKLMIPSAKLECNSPALREGNRIAPR